MNIARHIIIYSLLLTVQLFSQVSVRSIGFPVGVSSFSGNSPKATGLYINPSIDFYDPSLKDLFIRVHGIYMSDFNSIFSSSTSSNYTAHLYGGGVSLMESQPVNPQITLEYGAGFIVIRDRTYSDINVWAYGVHLDAGILFNVYQTSAGSLLLGAGGAFGQAFSETNPGYFAYYAQLRYIF